LVVERERIIDRLAKLLALAASPNANEASTAQRLADSLMAKHNLSKAEVAVQEHSGFYELPMGSKGFDSVWKFSLVTATARFCGCEAIALQVGKRRKLRLAGERENVESAAELFESLLKTLKDLEKLEAAWLTNPSVSIYTTPGAYVDSFRRGATVAIIEMMMQQQPECFGRKGRGVANPSSPETTCPPFTAPAGCSGKSSLFPKWWPWRKLNRRADGGQLPVGVPPESSLSLVLVPASKSDNTKQHREKLKSKYAPRKVRLDLENADDEGAYCRGYRSARSLVELPIRGTEASDVEHESTSTGTKTKTRG
jgi:hypothetical protein